MKKVRTPKKVTVSKEAATNKETMKHIENVRLYMGEMINELNIRADIHDKSKMEEPELKYFTEFTDKLKDVKYGSPEYKKMLESLKPALDHHYANNSHHPEHYKNGINGMTLVDLIELMADWQASVLRSKDGDIHKSLKMNKERFKISDQLEEILNNTIDMLERE
jgi:hypothetical protein